MKVLDAIEAVCLHQTVPVGRFSRIEARISTPLPNLQDIPLHFQWTYSLKLSVNFRGPSEVGNERMQVARVLVAHELYGELIEDTLVLLRILSEESSRPEGDPVLLAIYAMLDKMRGK